MKRTLGVCYYPEHWPKSFWKEDAKRMAEAGLSWPCNMRTAFFYGVFGKPAPTATDFEDMIPRLDIGKFGKPAIFVGLRGRQIIAVRFIDGR